jgi:hypothetical protein
LEGEEYIPPNERIIDQPHPRVGFPLTGLPDKYSRVFTAASNLRPVDFRFFHKRLDGDVGLMVDKDNITVEIGDTVAMREVLQARKMKNEFLSRAPGRPPPGHFEVMGGWNRGPEILTGRWNRREVNDPYPGDMDKTGGAAIVLQYERRARLGLSPTATDAECDAEEG